MPYFYYFYIKTKYQETHYIPICFDSKINEFDILNIFLYKAEETTLKYVKLIYWTDKLNFLT